ncbi:hypothetical protein [Chitinibacter sp. S2-10]|uniref:hypothetical protein n=1 Tax=Chitinibacter sp. S2-10 TaxID=3373597 RepID=UPI003977458A
MRQPAIAPFWERFPFFFAYPFRFDSLLSLSLLSMAFWLLNHVIDGGIISLVLSGLLFVALLRHAFKVLERIALGKADEQAWLENTQEHPYRPYKQFLVLLIGAALIPLLAGLVGSAFGELMGQVALIVVSLALLLLIPASIMVLALTDDLAESMNPEELWRVMRAIGLPYLGMWGCLSLLTGSGAAASSLLLPRLPEAITPLLFFFINMYFVIVMYALMGYVLHQYHEALGIEQAGGTQAQNTKGDKPDARSQLAQAGELVRAGQVGEAIRLLAAAVQANPQDLSLREGYFKLLLASEPHRAELPREADRYLSILLQQKRDDLGLRVLESVRRLHPAYLPADGHVRAALGRAALNAHRHDLTLALVKGFDQQFGNHAALPEVLLLGARLASEHLRNDAQALKILDMLLQRFPNHAVRDEALQLQTVIQRLQQV